MLSQDTFSSILSRAEKSFGRPFESVVFHAFDENQMPTGAPLSATQYIEWLARTYTGQPLNVLQSITSQYSAAIESAKHSPGILPEALANLIVSGAVFEALMHEAEHSEPLPPKPAEHVEEHIQQPIQPAKNDERTQLEELRSQIMRELELDDNASLDTIDGHIEELISKKRAELSTNPRLSEGSREQEIKNYRTHLRQKTFALQSIYARLGIHEHAPEAAAVPQAPTSHHLSELKAEEEKLLKESEELEKNISQVSPTSQRLQHVQTQIQIVEQLLKIIEEETAEEK